MAITKQKEIAKDNYFFVRSCIRQTFFPGAEQALINILKSNLKLNILEDVNHTSCTGIGFHTDIVPLETTMAVIARQFSLMNQSGCSNLLVSCVTSFGLYHEIIDLWHHHPELEAKTREVLWTATRREFIIPTSIAHTSDLLYLYRNELALQSLYQLASIKTGKPLKVVDHIGCHYAKIFPKQGLGGSEFPVVLSGLITSMGGESIDYPERRHCCGFGFRHYVLKESRGYSMTNTKIKLESMAPYNPDLIIANCPGCAMFLDRWQYTLSEIEGKTYDKQGLGIPVLTHEELAALMLGINPWDIGLQMHQVPVESLLNKIGISYSPVNKYKLTDSKPTTIPKKASILQ